MENVKFSNTRGRPTVRDQGQTINSWLNWVFEKRSDTAVWTGIWILTGWLLFGRFPQSQSWDYLCNKLVWYIFTDAWSSESNVNWNIFWYCLSAWLVWNKLQIDPCNRKIENTYFLNLLLNHLKTYLYFSLHLPKKWFTLYLKARDYSLKQSNSTFVSVKLTSSDISERLSVAP